MANTDPTTFTDAEKEEIKQLQMARARKGSDQMLIFLGQTVLGQVIVEKQIVETDPSMGLTWDELMDEVEKRRAIVGECTVIHPATMIAGNDCVMDAGSQLAVSHGEGTDAGRVRTVVASQDPPVDVREMPRAVVPQSTSAETNNYKSLLLMESEAIASGQATPLDEVPSPITKHRASKGNRKPKRVPKS